MIFHMDCVVSTITQKFSRLTNSLFMLGKQIKNEERKEKYQKRCKIYICSK